CRKLERSGRSGRAANKKKDRDPAKKKDRDPAEGHPTERLSAQTKATDDEYPQPHTITARSRLAVLCCQELFIGSFCERLVKNCQRFGFSCHGCAAHFSASRENYAPPLAGRNLRKNLVEA